MMFDFFLVRLDAQLQESMRNTLRYAPIQGEGLSSNCEGSMTFVGRSVRRRRWCYLRLGKGEMDTPQGGEQRYIRYAYPDVWVCVG